MIDFETLRQALTSTPTQRESARNLPDGHIVRQEARRVDVDVESVAAIERAIRRFAGVEREEGMSRQRWGPGEKRAESAKVSNTMFI